MLFHGLKHSSKLFCLRMVKQKNVYASLKKTHHSSISAVCRRPLKSPSELEENTEMITCCAQGKD